MLLRQRTPRKRYGMRSFRVPHSTMSRFSRFGSVAITGLPDGDDRFLQTRPTVRRMRAALTTSKIDPRARLEA